MAKSAHIGKIAIIIVLLAAFVNGGQADAAEKKPRPRKYDLSIMVQEILGEGIDDLKKGSLPYTGDLAKTLGLPNRPHTISETFDLDETTDKLMHACSIVIEESTTGFRAPAWFIFQARKESGRDSETFLARTSLDGVLKYADVTHGKLDAKSKPVYGAGIHAELDINSTATKERLSHELELWLEGKHLKPKFKKEQLDSLEKYRKKAEAAAGLESKSAEKSTKSTGKSAVQPANKTPTKPVGQ